MGKERISGCIFLLVGIYGIVSSTRLPMGRWNEPGPGVFPMALCILLSLAGALALAGRKKREVKAGKSGGEYLRGLAKPLQIVLLTAGFILAIERIGYLFAALLYLFLLFAWISRFRLAWAAAMAAAFGVGSWFLFAKILGVQLPLTFLKL
jgi:putative tricarboxylic transport membrane protein